MTRPPMRVSHINKYMNYCKYGPVKVNFNYPNLKVFIAEITLVSDPMVEIYTSLKATWEKTDFNNN